MYHDVVLAFGFKIFDSLLSTDASVMARQVFLLSYLSFEC